MRMWACFVFLVASVHALPPPVPSAGVVERELEKEYETEPLDLEKEIPSVEIDIPEETLHMPTGRCIHVQQIEVVGVESVSLSEIEAITHQFEDQKLCLKEIYEICAKIDAVYAKKGYFLARTYPPAQTVKGGVLRLKVIEGRLGTVEVQGNHFYSEKFIRSYFERLRGKSLRYDQFIRAILLLNETSDLHAAAVLTKGKEKGTADAIIRIDDGSPRHLYLNANNYGRDLTTNFRAGGRFDGGSLFTYGDKLSIAEVVGFPVNALYFTDVVYRVPVNRNGTFLEFAYLFSKFKIEELTSLNLKGVSNIATIKGSHAITRTRGLSIDWFTYFDYKQIKNLVLNQTTAYDKLRVFTLGSLFDHFPNSKGRDYLNVRMGVGVPNFLGGLKSVDSQCSRVGAGGLFVKFNADYDRLQRLWRDYFFTLHVSGQYSPYKLAVPEQVYLGGADTVRGFPLAVVLGDSGYYANLELKIPSPFWGKMKDFQEKKGWKNLLQFVGFLDHGGAFFYGGADTFLWGTGFGIRWSGPWRLNLSLDVGFPLNHKSLSSAPFTYIKITGQPF